MIYLITFGGSRPNRITEKKDKDYHCRYARFCAFNANNSLHQEYLRKVYINKQFYIGNQWIDDEDLEEFLKDDTGEMRNRLKIRNNIIRPIVEQYRGNAIRMQYNAQLKSFSKMAINRREAAYAEHLLHYNVSKEIPSLKPMLKRRYGVGDNIEETTQIFMNTYVDQFVRTMNDLITYVAQLNEFDVLKFEAALPMATSGIAIMKYFEYAGNMRFKSVEPEYFFWDRTGKKYDLSDADYWGEVLPMGVTDILEAAPDLEPDEQRSIEKWSTNNVTNTTNLQSFTAHTMSSTKVPTFYVTWKDTEKTDYGYVMDEFGYPYLTKINFTYPGEDKPKYTDKDLISVEPQKQKRVLGGKLKKSIYVDIIRYCHFVPMEIIGNDANVKDKTDIVLDYGVLTYQETENNDYYSAKPPYCVYTWAYVDGQVVSPMDDAIDPQRLINRITSVAENQINNSRGSGTVYDKSLLEGPNAESEMLRAMNQSRPVGIHAKGRGIQNIIGSYDGTIKQGTQVLFNIIDTFSNYTTRMTGVNEALQGQNDNPDALVGVTELMIQRGSLMQEPFYNAISEIMKKCYQAIASVGKNIYADNERELAIAVGDEGAGVIRISKEMKAEDFRAFMVRENVDPALISAANNMMLVLQERGLLDEIRVANLWGRSTSEAVSIAMREYAKEKIEMQREAAKNQEAQMADLTQKQAAANQMQVAQQEKQTLDNQASQAQADKTQLQGKMIEAQSKEKIAQINASKPAGK